jgi:hypothetical protein
MLPLHRNSSRAREWSRTVSAFVKVAPFHFGKMRAYAYDNLMVLVRDVKNGALERVEISPTAAKEFHEWLGRAIGKTANQPKEGGE